MVDSRVEDLSYDLERVIRLHRSYKPGHNSPNEQEELLMEFLHSSIVKNEDDASVIAKAAMYQLYPDITAVILGLGYRQSIVHQVKLNTVSKTRSISCSLLMAVL